MDKSTVICRCEEITVEDIELALEQGVETFDDIKRLTRSGMGPCQAKTCRILVSEIIAGIKGKDLADLDLPRMRIPLKPVSIGVLAAHSEAGGKLRTLLAEAEPEGGQGK